MATAPSSLIIFFLFQVWVLKFSRELMKERMPDRQTRTRVCTHTPVLPTCHQPHPTPPRDPHSTCLAPPGWPRVSDGPDLPGWPPTGQPDQKGRSDPGGGQDHLRGDTPKCVQEGRRGGARSRCIRLGVVPAAPRLPLPGRPPAPPQSSAETPRAVGLGLDKQTPPWEHASRS